MEHSRVIERLEQLAARDTAVVSTLRRSLSFEPGQYVPAFPIIEPLLYDASEARRWTVYLVAGLWATAQRRAQGTGQPLALALRRMASGRRGGDTSSSVDLRFTSLLDSDRDELPYRLRQVVSLINSDQQAIDWPVLLADLSAWGAESRYVQQRWAAQYWRTTDEPAAANNETKSVD